jgi:uncharacterized protein (DUF302 family)
MWEREVTMTSAMLHATAPGLVSRLSRYSVAETVNRLVHLLESKHIKVFARIDQSREAQAVGMTLRPTEILIFGDPKLGTPLMQASPLSAIDLPLKALAWEDAAGKVWLTYNSPEFLQDRYALGSGLIKNIAGIGALIEAAVA